MLGTKLKYHVFIPLYNMAVSEDILNCLLDELLEKLTGQDIVVISGSVPKGAPKDTYFTWVNACREKAPR